jgi:dihydroorotase-like cyclic amidohydrolase
MVRRHTKLNQPIEAALASGISYSHDMPFQTYNIATYNQDLIASWAADCAGLLHKDYTWHLGATQWQTPEVGEKAIKEEFTGLPMDKKMALLTETFGIRKDVAESFSNVRFLRDAGEQVCTAALQLVRLLAFQPVESDSMSSYSLCRR